MAKVYVSSTIVDLRQERQAVVDWLRAARHQAVDSYRPDSDTVRDSCLDDVPTCDLYVLILGHRYGFQPADGNPEGLSITHLEFRRAGQAGIPRIVLVRTSIPDVRLSEMENPERAALVLAFRDEVAMELRPAEFSDLQSLIQALSTGVLGELEKLGKRPEPPWAGAPVLRLPPRLPFLAGREELLAGLDARLADDAGRGPQVVALTGLGGAGKTSVAVEYAHRHLDEVELAWQFAAEDTTVLAAAFTDLAAQLRIGGTPSGGDSVVSVHSALATYPVEWLLIFDNVPNPELVREYLPPAGCGRVLITSRNALWPLEQTVEVPVLDRGVAAGFLMNRTGDLNKQVAFALAGELGGLPLALEQAAAYIQASVGTMARYLVSLQQRRTDMLARGRPAGYPGTVATTWALAFADLELSTPGAAGLLRLLAYCAPEAIPLRLLLQPRPGLTDDLAPEVAEVLAPLLGDELAAGDAVAALRRYSLARPAGDGAVSLHRLVQAVTTDQMPADIAGEWRQAAAAVIEAALPTDPRQPTDWPVYAALLPHAQAALPADRAGMERIAGYLVYSGSYVSARELYREVVEARIRVRGADHPDTLDAQGSLAACTGAAGDAAGAQDQFAALLPMIERVDGHEHPDTLTARYNLAHWTGEAGDPAGARDQFAALLPIVERVLGAEHSSTMNARHDLAHFTGQAGDPAGARDQFAALLPIVERVLGAEHPGALAALNNLAYWTGEAGDAAGARDQLAALLPVRDRVLGAEHPDTLTTRHDLAHWTGRAGNAAGARDQFAALLPVRERVLGGNHPKTLTSRANLAYWIREALPGNSLG